jgi:hypothetical protein
MSNKLGEGLLILITRYCKQNFVTVIDVYASVSSFKKNRFSFSCKFGLTHEFLEKVPHSHLNKTGHIWFYFLELIPSE